MNKDGKFYIGIFIQLPFPPIKNSMHTFYLQKRLSITAHNIFAWFYLWFLPSKYSIFLSSSTHESVNTLRQSNWCVLAHDTLHCDCVKNIHNSIFIFTAIFCLSLHVISYQSIERYNPILKIHTWTVKNFWEVFARM